MSWTIELGIAFEETCLSIKSPSLFSKKLLIANCVINLELLGPPISLSPNSISPEIALTTIPELRLRLNESSSPILTLFLKSMLPVLLYARTKFPTLKSPISFVPELYTLPGIVLTCSKYSSVNPPFCGNAL